MLAMRWAAIPKGTRSNGGKITLTGSRKGERFYGRGGGESEKSTAFVGCNDEGKKEQGVVEGGKKGGVGKRGVRMVNLGAERTKENRGGNGQWYLHRGKGGSPRGQGKVSHTQKRRTLNTLS